MFTIERDTIAQYGYENPGIRIKQTNGRDRTSKTENAILAAMHRAASYIYEEKGEATYSVGTSFGEWAIVWIEGADSPLEEAHAIEVLDRVVSRLSKEG